MTAAVPPPLSADVKIGLFDMLVSKFDYTTVRGIIEGTHIIVPVVQHQYGLTKVQRNVLQYIIDHIADKGISPSMREIQIHTGASSTGNSHRIVHELKNRGHITFIDGKSRSITVLQVPA